MGVRVGRKEAAFKETRTFGRVCSATRCVDAGSPLQCGGRRVGASVVNSTSPEAVGTRTILLPMFSMRRKRDRQSDALRATAPDRSETLRVPVLPSAPSPTLPGHHAPIDHLGQRFWPHVADDVRLTLDPVVRVDPHDRVLHRQNGDEGYWRPVGFTHGNGTPARSVICADVGPREMSDECPTCRGYRNGPRTRRSETPRASRLLVERLRGSGRR